MVDVFLQKRRDEQAAKRCFRRNAFLNAHATVYNLSTLGRHLISAETIGIFSCVLLRLGKGSGDVRKLSRSFLDLSSYLVNTKKCVQAS